MYSLNHITTNARYLARTLAAKPVFALRMVRNYAKAFCKPNRPPLRFVDIAVTYSCNMRCKHCSSTILKKPGQQELTVAQYREIARKLRRAGMLVVNFTGGEPLVRDDLLEIIRVFQPEKLLVAIQTNAKGVTETRLKELKQAGVDSLGISIDGPSPETHDVFRNSPGAFDQAIAALEMGSRMGFNLGISYCLTRQNLHSRERQEMVALSRKYNALLNYNLAVPIGFWRGKFENLLLAEDRKVIDAMIREHPHTKTDFETNYFRKGCGAIKEKLYVTAYGEVMPCPFIQVSFGDLLKDEVSEIRQRAFAYGYFQNYAPECLAAQNLDFIKKTLCYQNESVGISMPVGHENAFIADEMKTSAD